MVSPRLVATFSWKPSLSRRARCKRGVRRASERTASGADERRACAEDEGSGKEDGNKERIEESRRLVPLLKNVRDLLNKNHVKANQGDSSAYFYVNLYWQ